MSTLILCFHRVADPANGGRSMLAISPEDFERVLDEVGSRYEFVSLEEGVRPSRERRAVVTFDDGYADNLHNAAPILNSRGIAATFFLSTGFIGTELLYPPDVLDALFHSGGGGASETLGIVKSMSYWEALDYFASMESSHYWSSLLSLSRNLKSTILERDPLRRPMTLAEVRELVGMSESFSFGPHTASHRRMSSVPFEDAVDDSLASIRWFADQEFDSAGFFAYPYGQSRDLDRRLSIWIREQGLMPLTTYPCELNSTTRKVFDEWGLPRLSVGPKEIKMLTALTRILGVASHFPRVWLSLLSVRRTALVPRSDQKRPRNM